MRLSRKILLCSLLVILSGVGAWGYSGSYFTSDLYSGKTVRQTDQSLDGYWYVPQDHGCFENSNVFKFEGEKILTLNANESFDQGMYLSRKGGERFFVMQGQGKDYFRYFFSENDSQLVIYKIETVSPNNGLIVEANRPYFTRCESPTSFGLLLSFFNDVFDPNAPVSVGKIYAAR